MKPLKYLIFLTLTLSALAELKIGYFELTPHSTDQEVLGGKSPMISYFQKIDLVPLKDRLEINEYPLPRLISKLANNSIDIGLYLAKSEEREKLFQFADTPLYKMRPSIAVLKSRFFKAKAKYAQELFPQRVCVWEQGYLSKEITASHNKLVKLSGDRIIQRCLEMTRLGRVDSFYTPDHLSLIYALKKMGIEDQFIIIPIKGGEIGLYTVFSNKASKALKDKFNEKINHLIREGQTYEKLFSKIYE